VSSSAPNSIETGWAADVQDCCAAYASEVCKDGSRNQITPPCAGSVRWTDQLGYPMASEFRVQTVQLADTMALVCSYGVMEPTGRLTRGVDNLQKGQSQLEGGQVCSLLGRSVICANYALGPGVTFQANHVVPYTITIYHCQ